MSPAPTSRTEASLKSRNHLPEWFGDVVSADFARTLERELAAKNAEIVRLKEIEAQFTGAIMQCQCPNSVYERARAEKAEQLAREAAAELAQLKTKVEQGGIITEDMEHLLDERDQLRAEVEGMKGKRAPVQGFKAGIPWEMHLRAYDVYRARHGEQKGLLDLEGRNCRGGFHVSELDEFIPGWRSELTNPTTRPRSR